MFLLFSQLKTKSKMGFSRLFWSSSSTVLEAPMKESSRSRDITKLLTSHYKHQEQVIVTAGGSCRLH